MGILDAPLRDADGTRIGSVAVAAKRRPNAVTKVFGGRMGSYNAATATTFHFVCELVDDFVAVRPVFGNASGTLSDKVAACAASALSTATDLNNSSGTWVNGTKDGSFTFSTAVAPATGRIGYTVTDWIPLTSVARTDSGTKPLVAVRAYISASSAVSVLGDGTDDFTNWASRTDGNLVAMRYQAVDGVGTPTSFTSTTNRSQCPIVGVQYLSKSGLVVTVGAVGDSITEGRGTYLGDSHVFQAVRDVAVAAGRKLEYCNFGWSAQTEGASGGFAARAHDILESEVCPEVLVMPTGSPNDFGGLITQSGIDGLQQQRHAIAAACGERRVVPVWWTFLPTNTAVHAWGSSDALRVADNARALAQTSVLIGDTATLYSGSTSGGQVQIGSGLSADGIHPNDAGNTAIKAALITPLTAALRYVQVRSSHSAALPNTLKVYATLTTNTVMTGGGLWVWANPTQLGAWTIGPRFPSTRAKTVQMFYVSVKATATPLTITATGTDTFILGGTTSATLTLDPGESAIIVNDGSNWRTLLFPAYAPNLHTKTFTGNQTVDRTASLWVFTGGSTATATLSAVANNADQDFWVKNRGTAALTLAAAGADSIYDDASTLRTSLILQPGETVHVVNDGTYWVRVGGRHNALGMCLPVTGVIGTTSPAAWPSANRGIYVRINQGGPISKVRIEVGTASGNISAAAYRNTGTGPTATPTGAPLATSGAVACPASGIADVSLGSTVYLNDGDWLFLSCDNTTATFRTTSGMSTFALFNAAGLYARQDTAHPAPTVGTLAATSSIPILVGVP